MRALAINGSPRKGGNTEIMLKTVLDELDGEGWETELVQVGGKGLRGCVGCRTCFEKKNNQCVIQKDNLNEIYAKMLKADAIILGSPVYFADVTTDMKALIERAGYVAGANDKAFAGKIGVSVAAVRRAGAVRTHDSMNHLFEIAQMIVPGSTYWNLGIGREKEEVNDDAEGLKNMRHLGQAIAWLGKAIKPLLGDYPKVL